MAGDSAPHPTPGTAGGSAIPGAATLLLRVWCPEKTALRWDGAHPWLAMLRQAVVSSGGVPSLSEAGEGELLAGGFPSVASARRAGHRLHALVSGYAAESKGQVLGAAALIFPETVTDTAALTRYLQQKAHPAQTLLAARQDTLPLEARRIDDISFGELALYELSYAHWEEAATAAETLLREHKDGARLPQPPPSLPATPAARSIVARMRAKPLSVAAALTASLVVVAGVTTASWTRHPAPALTPTVQGPTAQNPVVTKPQPLPEPPVKTAPAPSPLNVDHIRKPKPAPEPAEVTDKPKRGRSDLSADQIRQILNRGQNALDRGCYTEAIGLYRRVLEDDPRNGSAAGGQEKARVRMRLSGENAQCAH